MFNEENSDAFVGEEHIALQHTVKMSYAGMKTTTWIFTPWFSNARLLRENLHWRICLGERTLRSVASHDARNGYSGSHHFVRDVFVQAALAWDKRYLMSDPRRFTPVVCPSNDTSISVGSIYVDIKWGSNSRRLSYSGDEGCFSTQSTMIILGVFEDAWQNDFKEVTMTVRINLLRPHVEKPAASLPLTFQPSREQVEHSNNVLRKMLADGAFVDVTLNLGKDSLKAHRAVLAASSPVFKAMFSHEFTEKESGQVAIEDVSVDVMRLAIEHMYGMELKGLDGEMYLQLLRVAEKYQMATLKSTCEDVLECDESLDELKALVVAEEVNSTRLKDILLRRVVQTSASQGLLNEQVLNSMCSTHPRLIVDMLKAVAAVKHE